MRDLIIDGVPLRDPLGMWFIDYTRSSLFGQLSRQFGSEDLMGYHGVSADGTAFFGAAQDTLVLNIQGTTEAAFTMAYRALTSLFLQERFTMISAPQRSALTAKPVGSPRNGRTFNVASALLKTASGRVIGSPAVERVNAKAARVTYIIERPQPFWQGTVAQVETWPSTTTATLAGAGDSTAPITDGLVRVRGPVPVGGLVMIQDRGVANRGLNFMPSVALTASQWVLIDLTTLQAKRHIASTWDLSLGTDERNAIRLTGLGGFNFSPEVNTTDTYPDIPNRYWYALQLVGTTTAVVDISIRRAYFA